MRASSCFRQLLEVGARLFELLGGGLVAVELDAGVPAAIGARSVVERAGPGLGDEHEDLACALPQVVGIEHEGGHRLLEEPEGALAVRLVLRAKGRGAHA
jgi:hypothetical protein